MVGAAGIQAKLPDATISSYARLCKRGRPGRFKCGDHDVKSFAFNAPGTHLAGSWRRGVALHLTHFVSIENPRCVSDRPRQHRRMCCHNKDGILSSRTARYVQASPRTVETAFSTAPLL